MQSNEVQQAIGTEVYWTKAEALADLVSYDKGWATIKTDDGEEHKVRAKEIVVMGDDDEGVAEAAGTLVEEERPDPSGGSSPVSGDDGEPDEWPCPECGEYTTSMDGVNLRCKSCGHMWRVRLFPKKENYTSGLGETPSGRDTFDINDEVAAALRGTNFEEGIEKVCAILDDHEPKLVLSKKMYKDFRSHNGELCEFLRSRYDSLNEGMRQMNLRNLLRGAYKRIEIWENTPESERK